MISQSLTIILLKGCGIYVYTFDEESFYFLKKLNTNKIKIASFDTVNTKFLKTIAKKNQTLSYLLACLKLQK